MISCWHHTYVVCPSVWCCALWRSGPQGRFSWRETSYSLQTFLI